MRHKRSARGGGVALMRDVAELAGVAISTVSRTLTNPDRVTDDTRLRVMDAAEKLGYTPNAAARSLRVGKSNTVMIVLPGPSLSYGASQVVPQALEGIASVFAGSEFNVLISNVSGPVSSEGHIVDLAYSGTVRGAIVLSSQELPSSGRRSFADAGIPIVALFQDLSDTGIPSVVTNDRQAMRQAVVHLIGQGHRSFFYIAGPRGNYHELERFAGLRDALAESSLSEEAVTRFEHDLQFQGGFQSGDEAALIYLAMARRPAAVVSCSDDAAIAFMATVRRAGMDVPASLSIVGFDGAPVGIYCEPALTTLQQPAVEMGKKAATILLSAVRRTRPLRRAATARASIRHVAESVLIIRKSTGPAPV